MSVVDDVQEYLDYEGITDPTTWPSVRRRVHDGSDQLVVLTEDGGALPEIPATTGIGSAALGTPAVQVRVRGKPWDGDSARAKAEEVILHLHGRQSAWIGETLYRSIQAQTLEPVFMGFDDKGRPEFTVSLLMTRGVPAPTATE